MYQPLQKTSFLAFLGWLWYNIKSFEIKGLLKMRRCPACNASVGEKDKFCTNCGNPLVEYQQTEDSAQMLLEKACAYMHKNDFVMAAPLIEEVLERFPQHSDGYMIKLLCKLYLKNINELKTVNTPLTDHEEFQLAQKYAAPYQLERNNTLLEENTKYIEQKRQENRTAAAVLQQQIRELRSQIQSQEKFLADNPLIPERPVWRKVLRVIELIFMVASVIFWTMATLVAFFMIVIDAPFILRLIFIIRRDKREKARPQVVQQATQQLHSYKTQLQEKTAQLEALKQQAF